MHLRTSAILALSALSLGACISQPNSAPITSPVKDRVYYSGLNLNQDKAMKPQTVQIVRQGEVTPSWFKVNPLYLIRRLSTPLSRRF